MSRIDGAGRSNRAGNASEPVEPAKRSVDPAVDRREAEAAAELRRNRRFGGAEGVASRAGGARTAPAGGAVRPDPARAGAKGSTAAGAATGVAGASPRSIDAVAGEVMRLRAEKASTRDPAKARALDQTIRALSSRWCEMARARGMKPPSDAFDASQASDAELAQALLWMEVGNTYPVSALVDGGARYQKELHLALVVRSPRLLAQAIAAGKGNDPALLAAMYKELRRLGDDRPCLASDTLESLAGRRAEILRQRDATKTVQEKEDERRQKTIGLDGHVGTGEAVIHYEIEQGMIAANPGSFLGTIGAGISASQGGSIEDRRRAGEAGNAAEGLAGIVKPNEAKKKTLESIANDVARMEAEGR